MFHGEPVLDIGFHIRPQSSDTLATLGRGPNTDVFVEGSGIGRVQCSFEINRETGIIMLYDRSASLSTQVFGEGAMKFNVCGMRRVVVLPHLNTEIGMGGERSDLVRFRLVWHVTSVETIEKVKAGERMIHGQEDDSRLARTVDEASTSLPSERVTRIHTPGLQSFKMRYVHVCDNRATSRIGYLRNCIQIGRCGHWDGYGGQDIETAYNGNRSAAGGVHVQAPNKT
jgi:hypothetical protein